MVVTGTVLLDGADVVVDVAGIADTTALELGPIGIGSVNVDEGISAVELIIIDGTVGGVIVPGSLIPQTISLSISG